MSPDSNTPQSTKPFSFDPYIPTQREIDERNMAEHRTGTRHYLPSDEARENAANAKSAVLERLESWGGHPDERVSIALLRNRDIVRAPQNTQPDDLQSVQTVASFLPRLAVHRARQRGLVWTALLEELALSNLDSLRKEGKTLLRKDLLEGGPLSSWIASAPEQEVLELLQGRSAEFREMVYASTQHFTEAVREQAWEALSTGLVGLASNRALPEEWVEQVSERAMENIDTLNRSSSSSAYSFTYHGRRKGYRYGIGREEAGLALVRLSEAGHTVPQKSIEQLKEVVNRGRDAAQWSGVPRESEIAFKTLLEIPGALSGDEIRYMLGGSSWKRDNLPVDGLLAHPQMPVSLWQPLLNRFPEHASKVVSALRDRLRDEDDERATIGAEEKKELRDLLRGDLSSIYRLNEDTLATPEEMRANWRILAERAPMHALEVIQEKGAELLSVLQRADWAFLVDVVRFEGIRKYSYSRRAEEQDDVTLAGRILLAIPEAAASPEVREALAQSREAPVLKGMLESASPLEVRGIFRRYAESDLEDLAGTVRADAANKWLGYLAPADLVPMMSAGSGEVRQSAIAVMGQVGTRRKEGELEWSDLKALLDDRDPAKRESAWAECARRFPRELIVALDEEGGEELKKFAPDSTKALLHAHSDRWVKAEALLLLPSEARRAGR